MLVKSARFSRVGNVSHFEAEVRAETAVKPDFTVRFDVHAPIDPPAAGGDAWLAALLVPAMFAAEDLEIQAPVSGRLVRTVSQIQAILQAWYPDFLNRITIRTPAVLSPPPPARHKGGVAVFFSGGVDSWYSLWKNRQEISHLITVKGFDIPYGDQTVWPDVVSAHRQIAAELGKELIIIETDLRDHVDPSYGCFKKPFYADSWGRAMHGACLASVGLLLQDRFEQVIVPASWHYARLQPWGSHPLFDFLWSNGRVEFLHDGAEAPRLERTRLIAESDLALRHLRVCAACIPGRYNCSTCEKCRRTMLTLRLLGVLDRAKAFDRPLDLWEVETAPMSPHVVPLYLEILAEAEQRGDAEIVRLVRVLTGQKFSARRQWRRLRDQASDLGSRAARKIGIPRWKRSLLKRIKFLRNVADRGSQPSP